MALVIINAVINKETITARGILALLVPRNYYVVLFVALTLLSPYLNWFISKLSKKQFEGFLILALLLFSVQPTFIDILEGLEGETFPGTSTIGISGSQWGYTIVTFLLMYFIGAYVRLYGFPLIKKPSAVFSAWFITVGLLIVWKIIEQKIGKSIAAEHYENPLIMLSAALFFTLFSKVRLQSRLINLISGGCFTVFLTHIFVMIRIPVIKAANESSFVFMAKLLGCTLLVFVICDLIGMLYTFFEKKLFDFIEKRRKFYTVRV